MLDPLNRPRGHQLGIQIVGLLAIMSWDLILVFGLFYIIKITVGLRVDGAAEEAGLDIRCGRVVCAGRQAASPLSTLVDVSPPRIPSPAFSFQRARRVRLRGGPREVRRE